MAAERSVTHPSNYGEWDDDIAAAAIRAAGEVVAESTEGFLTEQNAEYVGTLVGKVARGILNEMGKAN